MRPSFRRPRSLYLDMNGIIHPCARPEGRPPPETPEEMYAAIFKYIDRIFSVVRPRKLLFMAIDGPAPRAKMNQQRTRRFKAAKERADKAAEAVALRAELKATGRTPPAPSDKVAFDSNVITPGTEFMANLAEWLRYYVQLRLHSDPGWANIKVILSDASVPGEGEHKIMEHVRLQRGLPGYNPNTRHVIHGVQGAPARWRAFPARPLIACALPACPPTAVGGSLPRRWTPASHAGGRL